MSLNRAGLLGCAALLVMGAGAISGRASLAMTGAALGLALYLALRVR